jgi:hypothetical protein
LASCCRRLVADIMAAEMQLLDTGEVVQNWMIMLQMVIYVMFRVVFRVFLCVH